MGPLGGLTSPLDSANCLQDKQQMQVVNKMPVLLLGVTLHCHAPHTSSLSPIQQGKRRDFQKWGEGV